LNNKDKRIDQLYSTLSTSHASNINKEAFADISRVLLDYHDNYNQTNYKKVCAASMGHGKSSVLISYLKWIAEYHKDTHILVAVREKQLAHDIFSQVSSISPYSIVNIDSDNKDIYELELNQYRIVIIQHQRLKNLTLGYGNSYLYTTYKLNNKKMKRQLIIDEKPDFTDSAIFDIGSHYNVLDWFDDLSEPLKLSPMQSQKYKSYIVFLLSEQLSDNILDRTIPLLNESDLSTERAKKLISTLTTMKNHDDNKTKYESLNKLKHYKNLLVESEYGRIDDYEHRGKAGRKIIISKLVDYSTLGMNILILDGTARANVFQYTVSGFRGIMVENRNDYTRLHIQVDNINTTKYSRNKPNKTTQAAISKRIKELHRLHKDLFILPMKEDIQTYIETGAIKEDHKHYYMDNNELNIKGVNLLNTVGKNVLKDITSLYLTSLPKKHADYYKIIAIALYGNELNLLTNNETDNSNWFQDDKLEHIYRGELYAEILQIIHRTALRKIDSNDKINIFMSYDEESEDKLFSGYSVRPISEELKINYLKKDANILPQHNIVDMSLYGRDKKLESFIPVIDNAICLEDSIKIGEVGRSFKNYINRHWNEKAVEINNQLAFHGLKVIEKKDRYSSNSKYIVRV
jgi:hypothetical protein